MKIHSLVAMAVLGAGVAAPSLLAPVWAQAAKPKAIVNANALALLKQMGQAYQALPSYSGAIKVEEAKVGEAARVSSGTIHWQRPNTFALKLSGPSGSMSAFSDGATLFASTTTDKTRFTKSAAPKDESALASALAGSSAASLLLPTLLGGKNLVDLLGLESDKNTTSLALGRADKMGGEAVDVVIATQPSAGGLGSTQFAFALGQVDHLLRQVKVSTGGDGRPFTVRATETLSDIKAGAQAPELPAETFAWTAPEGAEEVASLVPPRYGGKIEKGGKPFGFEAKDLLGKTLNLDQYKGKVVLIDFWATWCPPCREENPNIIAAYNRYVDDGFDIVGISLDSSQDALLEYIQTNGMPWRQVFDGKGWDSRVPGIYGVRSIPYSLLLGRDGKISAINPRGQALVPAIEAALDEPQPTQ